MTDYFINFTAFHQKKLQLWRGLNKELFDSVFEGKYSQNRENVHFLVIFHVYVDKIVNK